MNFKKIVAAVAAAAVAVSTMAISAFAANFTCSDPYAPDAYLRLVNEPDKEATEGVGVFTQAGLDPTTVYGFKITLVGDVNQGAGGGCGFNSQSTGWKSMEWGNAAAGKELSVADDNTITYLADAPVFAGTDTYCHIWIQSWWANVDVDVTAIQPLDKDGNAIDYASLISTAAEEAPAEEATEATEETTEAAEEEAAVEEETAVEEEAAVEEEVVEEEIVEEEIVEEEAAEEVVEEAPEADATTEATATGNVAVASIVTVMALAGAAAVAAKKRN